MPKDMRHIISKVTAYSIEHPDLEFLVRIKGGLVLVGIPNGPEGDEVEQLMRGEDDLVGEVRLN